MNSSMAMTQSSPTGIPQMELKVTTLSTTHTIQLTIPNHHLYEAHFVQPLSKRKPFHELYECTICKMRTNTVRSIRKHIRLFHDFEKATRIPKGLVKVSLPEVITTPPYKCMACKAAFHNKFDAFWHNIETHQNASCGNCNNKGEGLKTSLMHLLQTHARNHTPYCEYNHFEEMSIISRSLKFIVQKLFDCKNTKSLVYIYTTTM